MWLKQALSRLDIKPSVIAYQLQQIRFRKGEGRYRAPSVAKEKEKWIPKSMRIEKKEKVTSKSTEEIFKGRVPQDDVWLSFFYPRQYYSLKKSIDMHREMAMPAMLNNPEGLLLLDCELDFRTKKKTKFMSGIKNTVVLPHQYEDGTRNRVIAVCKSKEEKEEALALGAAFAGGTDLIKMIEKNEITREDYDHVVCTLEMLPELTTVRKMLHDHFPARAKGNVGVDLEPMVEHFVLGRTYQSTKESEAVGHVQVKIGRLNMPLDALQANFHTWVKSICSHRSPSLGPFITSAILRCPPSMENFSLQQEELVPVDQHATDDPEEIEEGEEKTAAEAA